MQNPTASLALALALLVPAGCAATPAAEGTAATEFSSDAAGDQPVPGVVRIDRVDRSTLATDGTVRYYLDNVSGEDQENLTARVIFYYPPTQQSDIALPFDTDVTEEKSIALFRGQGGFEFAAASRAFTERQAAGESILATRIELIVEELVQTVARDDTSPGTLLLNGQLECVGISPWELRSGMEGGDPQLWLELQNVSAQRVSNVEVRVVFFDGDEDVRKAETAWAKLPALAPGERARATIDLAGIDLTQARRWRFFVRTRQTSGLFG